MTKLAAWAALFLCAIGMNGCASDGLIDAWDVATEAAVPPSSIVVAVNSFDALEATATNYLSLPRCTGRNGPLCRDPQATAKIILAVRAGRVARNNLEQFLASNPGKLGPKGVFDALMTAAAALHGIMAQYDVKS